MSEEKSMKVYLGDGVYADYDGWHIVLTAENGISTTNTIYLDGQVYSALLLYHAKMFPEWKEGMVDE